MSKGIEVIELDKINENSNHLPTQPFNQNGIGVRGSATRSETARLKGSRRQKSTPVMGQALPFFTHKFHISVQTKKRETFQNI